MIINKKVSIRVVPKTLKYWNNLNYSCKVNDNIMVSVNDLPKKSSVKILCVCNKCERRYYQRAYRDTNVCGSCKTSKRLSGNSFGKNNVEYLTPKRDELLGLSKGEIVKKFDVTYSVVNRWLKEHKISLEKYSGLKKYHIPDNVSDYKSFTKLNKDTNIPIHVLYRWKSEGKLNIKTKFDQWNSDYVEILGIMDKILLLNKTYDLIEISEMLNVSYEQLRRAFRETGNNVVLHSYNKSRGELEVKDFIIQLGYNCNSKLLDKKYEIDCFVSSKNFGVEYCGEYWHRYIPIKMNRLYHKNKWAFCKGKNISLLTIFESEWINKKDVLKSMIKSRLGVSPNTIYARKCKVDKIESWEAECFHTNNHISGYVNSSLNYGLFYGNNLISVLSLSKSRFDKNYDYEITRFSSKLEHSVVGGLSKLFKRFIVDKNPRSCITYSDLRFGEGRSYEKIGFKYIKDTSPNYYYYNKKFKELESRMKYQKQNLDHSLGETELDIMENMGYYRIYDCGNKKYGWKNPSV